MVEYVASRPRLRLVGGMLSLPTGLVLCIQMGNLHLEARLGDNRQQKAASWPSPPPPS